VLPPQPYFPTVQRTFSRPFVAGTLLCICCAMLWRWNQELPLPFFDLYPLYYGGKAWLLTGTAYDLRRVVPADHIYYPIFHIGNSYPLPAVLLLLPLTLFPPQVAATLWVGLLVAGVLVGLRLCRAPLWLVAYVPLLEAIRIEQYTALILIFQLVAIWALQTRKLSLLAACNALILTKPSHGLLFVLLMMLLARNWRQQAIAILIVWGGSLLVDFRWPYDWLQALQRYVQAAAWPTFWALALLAIPLVVIKDYLSAVVVIQCAIVPYPGVYAASSLYLGVLTDRRNKWLCLSSFFWPLVALETNLALGTALTLMLPVVILSMVRWFERSRSNSIELHSSIADRGQ
jgi:glycosyl transferase family 87